MVAADSSANRKPCSSAYFLSFFDRLAVLAQQVGLVRHDDLRTRREKLAVTGQFGIDLLDVVDRIAALAARRIDQMQQQTAAVDMAQEVMTEAGASLAPSMMPGCPP